MREGWVETKLGLVSEFIMGQAPLGKRCNKGGIGTPFVKAGEFEENRPRIVEWTTDPLKMAKSSDVLVCVVGATAGKINLGADCAIGRSVAAIRPGKELHQFFLYYLLSLELSNLRSGSRGSAQGVITKDDLHRIAVTLPPLPEQKRIVDLISTVDSYIEALQQQLESAKRSRNAVLHELLTAGGDNWLRAGLSEICTMIKRGQAPSYTEQKSVTVLNQKCVRNGRIQVEFARQTDSNIKPINDWAYLTSDDTLVNSTGVGTLGRVAFVGTHDEPLTVDSHLTIVRPDKNKIQPSFLGLSLHFREADIEGLAAGSSGQTELSREALGNLIITIPPLPEQKRIVEIIASLDKIANQTQLSISESQNLRSGLLSDLLSGEHEIPESYDKVIGAA
jgi:type I restriction enzyme, S subunit